MLECLTCWSSWGYQRRTLLCRTGYKGVFELELVGAQASKFMRREEEENVSSVQRAVLEDSQAATSPTSSQPLRRYFSVRSTSAGWR